MYFGLTAFMRSRRSGLAPPSDGVPSFQSFLPAGSRYIYEFFANRRYDILEDEWTDLVEPFPSLSSHWANGAVSGDALFVPRDSTLYRWDLTLETWSEA
jgi:hypothetical protein